MKSLLLVLAAAVALPLGGIGSCGSSDPTGFYQGIVQSKEAGKLKVTVNLRCEKGVYGGEITTPATTFAITGGEFSAGTLHLIFRGGATNAIGVATLHAHGTSVAGSYRLASDAGTLALRRVGAARASVLDQPVLSLSAAQWADDIRFEVRTLETQHPRPFLFTARTTLERSAAALESRLGTIDGDRIYVGLDHLANLIGDGHTYLQYPPDQALMPLFIKRYGDEYRIVGVAPGHEALLGERVLGIDGTPVKEVRDRFYATITPVGETSALRDSRATNFLNVGMALHGIGVTARRDVATYTLISDGGTRRNALVKALTPAQADSVQWIWAGGSPLYVQHPRDDFWFVDLVSSNAIYCSFRGYENLQANAARLLAFVRAKRPNKLVIDMRFNGGGDYNEGLKYLIDPLRTMREINRTGHLFVLVGTDTFSAAMANAAQFRALTHALLVGQTIGERPNSYQEPDQTRLPNSHLMLRYSTRYYEFAPAGPNAVVPDKEIAPAWHDIERGDDPVLDWALEFQR
jgi:hypothetical protein